MNEQRPNNQREADELEELRKRLREAFTEDKTIKADPIMNPPRQEDSFRQSHFSHLRLHQPDGGFFDEPDEPEGGYFDEFDAPGVSVFEQVAKERMARPEEAAEAEAAEAGEAAKAAEAEVGDEKSVTDAESGAEKQDENVKAGENAGSEAASATEAAKEVEAKADDAEPKAEKQGDIAKTEAAAESETATATEAANAAEENSEEAVKDAVKGEAPEEGANAGDDEKAEAADADENAGTAADAEPKAEKQDENAKATEENSEETSKDATKVSSGMTRLTPAEEAPTPKKKKHTGLKVLAGTILSLAVLAGGAYAGGYYFFNNHFGFGTSINDVDCSLMTVEEVQETIRNRIEDYSIEIHSRGDVTSTFAGSEVGLQYIEDEQVANILASQDQRFWFKRLWERDENKTTDIGVRLDESLLVPAVNKLPFMDESAMIAPADAEPEFDGTKYVIKPEDNGTTIDREKIYNVIKEAMLTTAPSVDIDEKDCYVHPKVTSESPELIKTVDTYNHVTSATITYHFGEKTEILNGADTLDWITFNPDGTFVVAQEPIQAFVADMAARHDTVGTTRTFTGGDGGTYTVSGGYYGWQIDQEAEIAAINQLFTDFVSQDREPHYRMRAVDYVEPGQVDWGRTWIDLNLTTQHMYYIQDGNVVFDTDVVTGLPIPERITPDGVFMILEKKQNKTLRGDRQSDGTYEYETPVAYWMRVTWSGVGFHTATWQPYFGGNRYQTNGSHGCINMSHADSQRLYELISVETPVVSHY